MLFCQKDFQGLLSNEDPLLRDHDLNVFSSEVGTQHDESLNTRPTVQGPTFCAYPDCIQSVCCIISTIVTNDKLDNLSTTINFMNIESNVARDKQVANLEDKHREIEQTMFSFIMPNAALKGFSIRMTMFTSYVKLSLRLY